MCHGSFLNEVAECLSCCAIPCQVNVMTPLGSRSHHCWWPNYEGTDGRKISSESLEKLSSYELGMFEKKYHLDAEQWQTARYRSHNSLVKQNRELTDANEDKRIVLIDLKERSA